jgi:hypothetical protein
VKRRRLKLKIIFVYENLAPFVYPCCMGKIFVKITFFLMLFVAIGRFCDKKTEGFSLYKIAPNSLSSASFSEDPIHWNPDQRFYFLGRGGQSFAFISEDGKTVIKFFKHHQMYLLEWFKKLPLPTFLHPVREKFLKKHRHRSSELFKSCAIADAEFKNRTGLIYLHLSKTSQFKKKLTLVDLLGIEHQVDLDTTPFALQKRAEPAYHTFKRLLSQGKAEEAKQCIDSLVALMVERFQKGIADRDPNIRRNLGFVGTQAIEIDLGSYTKAKKQNLSLATELRKKTAKFHTWLSQRDPSLALYLSEQIEKFS